MNRDSRPVNLNLFAFRFPITAIASIIHRVSGVMLVFCLPLVIWGWSYSLLNETTYQSMGNLLSQPLLAVALWLFVSLLFYHLLAGIKHLGMDIGWGEGLRSGRLLASLVIALSAAFSLIVFYLLLL